MDIKMHGSWKPVLNEEFEKPYFNELIAFVKSEYATKVCYPKGNQIFSAFDHCHFDEVKVVIIGQDPYHGPNQAHGLCFSVQRGVPPPPSLLNIFKELQDDIGCPIPTHGDLTKWAQQGVFLLNASLSVRAAEPMSHARIGWALFTDTVIRKISAEKKHVVFMLWGKFAQEKRVLIDDSKHLILRSVHPSPLSAHAGFFGCKHFSKANEYLMSKGIDPIDWKLD